MLEQIDEFLEILVGHLWGLPLVVIMVGGGIFFTLYLGGIQFRGFKHALDIVRGKYDDPNDPGEITHFRALCTALSGTVGLGNIAGVAVAIKMGGPGATIWMILAGFVGMATKYAECTLAVKFRKVDEHGVVHGGPMHYIEMGLGEKFKPLSYMFAICCIFTAFGAANLFQANQVAASLEHSFGVDRLVSGIVLATFAGLVILGGIKRIGAVAGYLVPIMGGTYFLACLLIILLHFDHLPEVLSDIINGAISGTAAIGGFVGVALRTVIVQGVRRAVFSNEAGLGTASIAHSAAKTKEPAREGMVALLEPFIDTIVICTMTALVINITDVWKGDLTGVALTQAALDLKLPGFGTYFIPIAVSLFAFSTLISWSYYAERALDYMFTNSNGWIIGYRIIYCLVAIIGAQWTLSAVLNFSDSMAALMVIPNMIALILLSKVIRDETKEYFRKLDANEFKIL
jgi:alanine or glycine:cation symporter, AGCS family